MFKHTAFGDIIVFTLSILAFVWGSWNFHRWGLLLFIPILMCIYHDVVIDRIRKSLQEAKEEDIECMKPQPGDHGYEDC